MNAGQHPSSDDAAIDFRGVSMALWRAKSWIIPLVVITGVGTYLGLSTVDPLYMADSRVLIESKGRVLDPGERGPEGERALLDEQGVASQQQLIESRDLARRVIRKLELAKDPEFDVVGSGNSSLVADLMALLGIGKDPLRLSPEERVIEKYYKQLNIFTVKGSRVITVEFTSKSPKTAAKVANAIVEEYLAMQRSAKRAVTETAAGILKPEVDRLRREVKAAERRAVEFRSGADLLLGRNNVTLVQQQMADLAAQLATARAARSEASAKAELIKNLLKSGKAIDTSSDVLASNLIQRLRERQVALKARISELSITLLSSHPQIKAARSQLAGLDQQIRAEVRKILVGLENDVKVADARVLSLEADLNGLKAAAAKSNEQLVRMRELERDAQIKSTELQTLLARYRRAETGRNATALPADARVISAAFPPPNAFWPRKIPITAVATIAILMLSIVFVTIREFASGRALRYPEAAGTPIGLPIEPEISSSEGRVVEIAKTTNPAAESQTIQSAHGLTPELTAPVDPDGIGSAVLDGPAHLVEYARSRPQPARRVLVTSAIGNQESEETAAQIARAASLDQRIVLIDAHESAMVRTEKATGRRLPGLGELMTGKASFEEVIYRDPDTRYHRIGCGDFSGSVGEPGAVDRLMLTLEALAHTYDFVVVDLGFISADELSAKLIHQSDLVALADGNSVCQATALALSSLSLTGVREVRIVLNDRNIGPIADTEAA